MPSLKQRLANGFEFTGLNRLLLGLQPLLWRRHVRAVNYHDVPKSLASAFEDQLQFYKKHFYSVGLDDLRDLAQGRSRNARPGLILSFDDGLRSHHEVVAPLLEKHGFCGWFMVPVDFVDVPQPDQADWARRHQIQFTPESFPDQRVALSWNDVRDLDRAHVVACHTRSHRRLNADLTEACLREEIVGSKQRLEEQLGHEASVFAWVGGEEESYSAQAARVIRDAGFEFSFMTNNAVIRPGTDPLQLQRSNVEASFPISLVRFTLSGFYDALYWPKRRRVNGLTATAAS